MHSEAPGQSSGIAIDYEDSYAAPLAMSLGTPCWQQLNQTKHLHILHDSNCLLFEDVLNVKLDRKLKLK